MTVITPQIIATTAEVRSLVEACSKPSHTPPSLYIDIEGINLCRRGTISIIQIFLRPENKTYLVDIHALGEAAFSTPGSNGMTLKDILESTDIQKAFFDVRNDSDALYHLYGVHLAGVEDIQLLQLATRTYSRRHVHGLARCIQNDASMTFEDRIAWNAIKERGRQLFAPEKGGSYEVLNERPLPEDLIKYCTQDVEILPRLWDEYNSRLSPDWKAKVETAVRDRIDVCLSPTYTGQGEGKSLAPAGWPEYLHPWAAYDISSYL